VIGNHIRHALRFSLVAIKGMQRAKAWIVVGPIVYGHMGVDTAFAQTHEQMAIAP
jgi:hypothetical protein